jgi:hypothetical protein
MAHSNYKPDNNESLTEDYKSTGGDKNKFGIRQQQQGDSGTMTYASAAISAARTCMRGGNASDTGSRAISPGILAEARAAVGSSAARVEWSSSIGHAGALSIDADTSVLVPAVPVIVAEAICRAVITETLAKRAVALSRTAIGVLDAEAISTSLVGVSTGTACAFEISVTGTTLQTRGASGAVVAFASSRGRALIVEARVAGKAVSIGGAGGHGWTSRASLSAISSSAAL